MSYTTLERAKFSVMNSSAFSTRLIVFDALSYLLEPKDYVENKVSVPMVVENNSGKKKQTQLKCTQMGQN